MLTQTWESRTTNDVTERLVLFEQADPPFLVFACQQDLQVLHESKHWICDGTFDYCPPEFSQTYSLQGFLKGEGLPLVVALMPSKTRADYSKAFSKVIKNALWARHGTVGTLGVGHSDFEVSAIPACEDVFAGVTVKGCLFHFSQCFMRKLAELGLRVRFLSVDVYRNMNS
ncbi:hypothetical protein HPB48_023156 [Haemaphysalis longicornis]|uniref:MULE transposase domain-containing protein n=1 Tax=Haemaphysalis longicornis TaxID=44386 RepID=A0A9J6GQ31_HAELO|nr:hypothetical protein HPB48_023156 [Haemaphysalis longicornis]